MKHNSSLSSVSEVPLAGPLMKPQQCHGWPVSGDLLLSALCSLFTVFTVLTIFTVVVVGVIVLVVEGVCGSS